MLLPALLRKHLDGWTQMPKAFLTKVGLQVHPILHPGIRTFEPIRWEAHDGWMMGPQNRNTSLMPQKSLGTAKRVANIDKEMSHLSKFSNFKAKLPLNTRLELRKNVTASTVVREDMVASKEYSRAFYWPQIGGSNQRSWFVLGKPSRAGTWGRLTCHHQLLPIRRHLCRYMTDFIIISNILRTSEELRSFGLWGGHQ